MAKDACLQVKFLGGVGEIGKNMTCLEFGDDIIIIDAGLSFPTQDMPGIDVVIPDITYLINNKDKIRGLFITHGHEDHIGGVPYLLREINVPIYGTKLSLNLIEGKLREFNITDACMYCVEAKSVVQAGCFTVELINVNHSIPGSVAFFIKTPAGNVFHSGDFKIDLTPVKGEIIDLARLSEISRQGITLMMCESTNVEREGTSLSESVVQSSLDRLFNQHKYRRIVIATFASNVYRIQQILDLAYKNKRKVALFGKSMVNVIDSASKIGDIVVPENTIIEQNQIPNYSDKELVLITTGSQGEPMSALTRMAQGEFPNFQITPNDTIIISASPIPGNEKNVYSVINNLYRKGAEVVYESLEKIHASGHACLEELKIMHTLIRPKFFIPVHGEYRHLKKHADLAMSLGMKEGNIQICEIGDTVLINRKQMKLGDKFQAGSRLVDGLAIDETEAVVRDRKHMSDEGIIVVVCYVSSESGLALKQPDIIGRGSGVTEEMEHEMKEIASKALEDYNVIQAGDVTETRRVIRKRLREYMIKTTKKNPMILPIITKL